MRKHWRLMLLCGASSLVGVGAAVLASYAFGRARAADTLFFLGSALYAISLCLGAVIAGRRQWLEKRVTAARASLSALPLLFLPVASMIMIAGWGDPEEHVVRGFLHTVHRALPRENVAMIAMGIGICLASLISTSLIWLAISILTAKFRLQPFLLFSAAGVLLGVGAFFVMRYGSGSMVAELIFGVLFLFGLGVLFGVALVTNTVELRSMRFVVPLTGFVVLLLAAGGIYALSKSSPEIRLPVYTGPPLWTLDIASPDCSPLYGGPNSYSAPDEIAFSNNVTLGMLFPSGPTVDPTGKWKYGSCLITINAESGRVIARKVLSSSQNSISGEADGSFSVADANNLVRYSPDLEEIAKSNSTSDASHSRSESRTGISDILKHFSVETEGTLSYINGSERRQLAQSGLWRHSTPTQRGSRLVQRLHSIPDL